MARRMTLRPPALARRLLSLAAHGETRAALLGDMEEEFAALAQTSPAEAGAWYWRQTLASSPALAGLTMRRVFAGRLAITLGAAFGAVVFLHYWELIAARAAARGTYALIGGGFGPARGAFVLTSTLGSGIAGAVFARLAAPPHLSRPALLARRSLPAALLIAAPALMQMLAPANTYPLAFSLAQTILGITAFIGGGALSFRKK